ncbi:hypothetical protein GCM10010106_40300 [Thermopolyspora flexuosa]|nr:hypothetical protein GCM10010106_40300 [Thermopolyspora flexuosa]
MHRDFKPSNVLLAPDGPRVIDFGIARLVDLTTTTGTTAGSPPYMAPEHFTGARIGPEADVFAWGATMAFAATGRPPFGDDNLAAVAYRILHSEPDLGALPRPLREVVRRCLAKDPARRPSANEVLHWLLGRADPAPEEALEQGRAVARGVQEPPDATGPPTRPSVPRRRILTGAAVTAALAVSAAVLGQRIWSGRSTEAPARPAGGDPPMTPLALAVAIDTALADTPCATFEFQGGFADDPWHVAGRGRMVHAAGAHYPDTAYDMQVAWPGSRRPERVIVKNRVGYAVQRRKPFVLSPDRKPKRGLVFAAQTVAALSSPQTLIRLITGTRTLQREGGAYTATILLGMLDFDLITYLVGEYVPDDQVAGYLTYTLTLDERDLPTELRLVWGTPAVLAPAPESDFVTRYRDWRAREEITLPG